MDEIFPTFPQEFKILARRKKLRRLEDIMAFNVAGQIYGDTDIQDLPPPKTIKRYKYMYLDTFSVDL